MGPRTPSDSPRTPSYSPRTPSESPRTPSDLSIDSSPNVFTPDYLSDISEQYRWSPGLTSDEERLRVTYLMEAINNSSEFSEEEEEDIENLAEDAVEGDYNPIAEDKLSPVYLAKFLNQPEQVIRLITNYYNLDGTDLYTVPVETWLSPAPSVLQDAVRNLLQIPDPLTTPPTVGTPESAPDVREGRRSVRQGAPPPIMLNIDDEPAPEPEEPLPTDKDGLKKLLEDTVQGLLDTPRMSNIHIDKIGKILEKDPSIVNEPLKNIVFPRISRTQELPLIFAVFFVGGLNSTLSETLIYKHISDFLEICKKAGANPLLKFGKGIPNYDTVNIFEYTVIMNMNYGVTRGLIQTFGLKNVTTSETQPKELFLAGQDLLQVKKSRKNKTINNYNELIQSFIQRAIDQGKNPDDGLELSEDEREQISDYNKIIDKYEAEIHDLLEILTYLYQINFTAAIENDSDDNYTLIPVVTKNSIDLSKFANLLKIICLGSWGSNKTPIKNNFEFLQILLKHGFSAFDYIDGKRPLMIVLEDRVPNGIPPSYDMVHLLLKDGADVSVRFSGAYSSGEYKFVVTEIIKKYLENPKYKQYEDELKKILAILYKALAIHLILATPVTSAYARPSPNELKKNSAVKYTAITNLLANLFEFHPEAFEVEEPVSGLPPQEINPDDSVFDVIMQEDIKISEFLEEDDEAKNNNIIFRNYDSKTADAATSSTLSIDIRDIIKAVSVNYSKLDYGEIAEKDAMAQGIYNPQNSDHVPAPGEKGGSGVVYKCNRSMQDGVVSLNSVNNLEPYFDMKSVGGYGLIPLLEVYSKIILPKPEVRGQYFSYKAFNDKPIYPISSISSILYPGTQGNNRYNGYLNYVSASHCFGAPDCGPSPEEPGGWLDEDEWNECNKKKEEDRRDAARLNMIIPAVKVGEKVEPESASATPEALPKPQAAPASAGPAQLDPFSLNDAELRSALTAEGVTVGPINDTTRKTLMRKLERILRDKAKPSAGGKKYRKPRKTVKKLFKKARKQSTLRKRRA